MFRQCWLTRPYSHRGGQDAVDNHFAWIPEEFAKKGKVVDILDAEGNGKWSKGWTVHDVFTRATDEYVREHETDHKRQRKASDV